MSFSGNFDYLSEGVILFKKFLTEESCSDIMSELVLLEHNKNEDGINVIAHSEVSINNSDYIESLISKVVPINFNVMHGGFQFMSQGDSMAKHHDLYHFNFKEANKEYSIVLYLNNFEGGEINYPDINIVHSPKIGDLILHKPSIRHEVLKLKSENRYTYTSFLWSQRNVI
jgi:predicted 2-oxoglutarate/Fe(II)-dependent dioxygenase YbiX